MRDAPARVGALASGRHVGGRLDAVRPASRVRRLRRCGAPAIGSTLAVLAMAVGALWFVGISVLHDRLLDRRTYLEALDDTGTYGRLYSEVLTDEAVRDLTSPLLDGLAEAGVARQDAASVANAALRLALPPAMLRAATEALVSDVLAYLRGDQPTLVAPVGILDVLQPIDPAAAVFVREAVMTASSLLVEHAGEVEAFTQRVADGVADGQIPSMVPFIGGRRVAEQQLGTALDGLTSTLVPADVRAGVLEAIGSSDHRDAIIASALGSLRASLQHLSDQLAVGGDIDIDLVHTIIVASGQDRAAVTERADSVRDLVARFPSGSRFAGPAVMLASGIALIAVRRGRRSAAVCAEGVALLAAGAAVWCGWMLVSRAIGSPLHDAVSSDQARAIPASATRLLADVDRAMSTSLSTSIAGSVRALVLLGAGAVTVGAGARAWATMTSTGHRRLVGAVAVSALATVAFTISVQPMAVRAGRACNGHAELCDRRYDDIVQAATHNSMSSPDVVRIWPEHDGNIRQQLDHGIRMLMIDASYWDGVDTTELTWLRTLGTSQAAHAASALIESRLAPRSGVYLCHSACALGAIPVTTALAEVKGFLDDNPDEVVTLMIQDRASPADIEAAFHDSGLSELVYEEVPGSPWPTLAEMIDRGQRLVVFSEQHASPPSWYLGAFTRVQDTPYRARSAAELTCAPNRGPPDAPLFLLNNWIESQAPDRAAAATVNGKDFIVERARRCATERGRTPNFIAVSFYGIGDVLGAVDELNGFPPP